jgi:hypothetical protein
MLLPACPPPPPHALIDWGTLVAGFALGLVGSMIGAFAQAWATSIMARRDHQFERMLKATDEIRHDVERAMALAAQYWTKDGSHGDCLRLEAEMMELQIKIFGTLAIVKQLDPQRFKGLEAECEDDFMDALTGGAFQVRDRVADPTAVDRVQRFGGRFREKIARCSSSPTARRPSLWV